MSIKVSKHLLFKLAVKLNMSIFEENKSIKISLEAQLRAKESEMEGYARKLRDFEERKDGIGHA